MVKRKIIRIDEELCDGCGLCATACHEGAIQIKDGKAKLISEIYCDGLGDCLAECPQDAITIEEREAKPFDEKAVEEHLARTAKEEAGAASPVSGGCPGSAMRTFEKPMTPPVGGGCPGAALKSFGQQGAQAGTATSGGVPSQLSHWPVQLKLVPPGAPFLKEADLLICADCVPFAVPDFHGKYLSGKTVLVGCPKLDDLQYYYEKLKAIYAEAKPRSITVLKMEVPCCAGIAQAAVQAREETIPETELQVCTIGLKGHELHRE
jgi:ferredoxin